MSLIKKNLKTTCIVIAKLLFTTLAFYIISKKITINPMVYITKDSINYFSAAMTVCLAIVFLQSWRWKQIVKISDINLPYKKSLVAVWVGHLINNFLPTATAGDLLRSYTLRYADNQSRKWQWLGAFLSEKYSAATSAVFLACVIMIIALYHQLPMLLMAFLGLLLTASIFLPLIASTLFSRLIYLHKIITALTNTFTNQHGRYAFLISFIINIFMCIAFYIIALGVGVNIKLSVCLFVVPVFTLLATLPISYAGWGVRELSCVGLLSFFGVSSESAIVISILYGLINLLSSIPGIFVAYPFISSIRKLSKQTEPAVISH